MRIPLTYIAANYAYGSSMRSYQEPILNYIVVAQPITRKEILSEFEHISPKTVYDNVNKLKDKNFIVEDKFGKLTVSSKFVKGSVDSWPLHPVLREHQNINAITNAFVNQDENLLEIAKELSHTYGTQMTILLNDLMIILATLKSVDTWKAYEIKHPVNRDELYDDLTNLKSILEQVRVPK